MQVPCKHQTNVVDEIAEQIAHLTPGEGLIKLSDG